jgi:uncharacterized protein YkwD
MEAQMLLRVAFLVVAFVALLASATASSSAGSGGAPPSPPGSVVPPAPAPLPAPPPTPVDKPAVKPVPTQGDKVPDDAIPIDDGHKTFREKHCVNWLRWSAQLADAAQERVDAITKACRVTPSEHSYGENVWSGTTGKFETKKVTDTWGAEGRRYNFKRGAYVRGAARFTQMVWKASNRYGCASAACKRNTYWVCLYDPAGNVDGEFAANVKSPSECKDKGKE